LVIGGPRGAVWMGGGRRHGTGGGRGGRGAGSKSGGPGNQVEGGTKKAGGRISAEKRFPKKKTKTPLPTGPKSMIRGPAPGPGPAGVKNPVRIFSWAPFRSRIPPGASFSMETPTWGAWGLAGGFSVPGADCRRKILARGGARGDGPVALGGEVPRLSRFPGPWGSGGSIRGFFSRLL